MPEQRTVYLPTRLYRAIKAIAEEEKGLDDKANFNKTLKTLLAENPRVKDKLKKIP